VTDGIEHPEQLLISAAVLDAMVAHCRRELPDECCGILGGLPPLASSFYPLRNRAEDPRTRYDADPLEIIEGHRQLRERGEEFVAIYHSHPTSRAFPSRADLALNYYGALPRIIVSLREEPPDVRAWRLDPDSYRELPWRAVPVEPTPPRG